MNLYARRGIEKESDTVILQYTNGRIWGKVKDNRTSDKKLLVTRSYEGSRKIYG